MHLDIKWLYDDKDENDDEDDGDDENDEDDKNDENDEDEEDDKVWFDYFFINHSKARMTSGSTSHQQALW